MCRIVHEKTKAIIDSLTTECIKFSESDAEYFDALATFQGKHIPNCFGATDGGHIEISYAPPNAGLISTIGRHTTPFSSKQSVIAMGNFWVLAVAIRAPSKRSDAEMFVFRDGKLMFSIPESQ